MTALVLAAATGLTAVFLVPQIVRVHRTRDVSGLSATWASFGLLTNLGWVLYLGTRGLWLAALAPILAVVTYGVMAVALARRSTDRRWLWAAGVYTVLLLWLGGIESLGIALVVAPVVQLTPAIVAAYRTRCPTGISPATWSLSIAEAVMWGWYGWLIGDLTLLGYGVVTGVGSLFVLVREPVSRPRLRPAFTALA